MKSEEVEAYFELSYHYDQVGTAFDDDQQNEQPFEYEIFVSMMFTWNADRQMYEVECYAFSETVDYVELPCNETFKQDVYRDLEQKGINLDTIPDFDAWNM